MGRIYMPYPYSFLGEERQTRVVFLPSQNLYSFANDVNTSKDTDFDVPEVEKKVEEFFKVNKLYGLPSATYEEDGSILFTYQLKYIISEVYGEKFSSLIMKKVDGPETVIYPLTRDECKTLNIPYEEGLQLFSETLSWVKLEEEINEPPVKEKVIDKEFLSRPFNPSDLSTYPLDKDTLSVCFMVLRLTGFEQINNLISTPSKRLLHLNEFINTLEIRFNKQNEPYEGGSEKALPFKFCTPSFMPTYGNSHRFVDDDNSIFVEVDLRHKDFSTNRVRGVDPFFLENKNVNDMFIVSWLEK